MADVLAVSIKLPQRKDTPSVAMALIIEDLATQFNVNTSKLAGQGVIKLLTPADRVAVKEAVYSPFGLLRPSPRHTTLVVE